MPQRQLDIMADSYREQRKFGYDLFVFREQTRVQLLSNQVQLFQQLGLINLAFIAVIIATHNFQANVLWISAMATSLVLSIYATTYVRETIDLKDKELNDEYLNMQNSEQQLYSKIQEAKQRNDFNIYLEYIERRSNKEPESTPLSYAGEIAIFLFLSGLFLTILGMLSAIYTFALWFQIALLVLVFICSFLTAVKNWNDSLTRAISSTLNRILKSPNNG